jgi:hypothetical protein
VKLPAIDARHDLGEMMKPSQAFRKELNGYS